MRKTGLIIFSYALLAFACCLGASFVFQHVPPLLDGIKTNYLVVRGLIYFLKILPSLVMCAFLVGASISYGLNANKAKIKYSKAIITHFKKTMVVSLFLVLGISLATEVFLPLCQDKLKTEEIKPALFDEYMKLADSYYQQGKMKQAYEYSFNAAAVNPKDPKAQRLKDLSGAAVKALKGVEKERSSEQPKFVYVPVEESDGETVYSLLKKARKAEEENDWFHAHYYAYMAVNIGNSRDSNFQAAQRLASEAWNHLFETKIFEETEEQILFRKKRDAYMSMINGDNVEAYYQFLEISNANELAARDPDVSQFLKITEERVKKQCFFIEETDDLKRFETANDIFFAVSHDDGSKDVVYIRGITPVKNVGKMVQYLRGFKLMSFDKDGFFRMSLSVPYAKMFSVSTGTFDKATKAEFGIKDDFVSVPYLILEGISQNEKKDKISPVYEFDAALGKNAYDLKNYFVLALSMSDFNMLCDAGVGAEKMSMISLVKLLLKAHDFGFSPAIYSSIFLSRITYPLFMLLAFMFLACIAWNYRTETTLFKFKWIFIMPFVTLVIFSVLELVLYGMKLLNFVLVSFTGNFALVASVSILAILFFAACFVFISRTSE